MNDPVIGEDTPGRPDESMEGSQCRGSKEGLGHGAADEKFELARVHTVHGEEIEKRFNIRTRSSGHRSARNRPSSRRTKTWVVLARCTASGAERLLIS